MNCVYGKLGSRVAYARGEIAVLAYRTGIALQVFRFVIVTRFAWDAVLMDPFQPGAGVAAVTAAYTATCHRQAATLAAKAYLLRMTGHT